MFGSSRKKNSFKSSCGDVGGGIEKKVREILPNPKNFWLKIMNWRKKNPKPYFSTKRSSGRVNTVRSTSESSKYKYCSLEMYFSSKIYSAEPVPSLETLLEKVKKIAREFLSNSLSTRRLQFWKELRVVLVSCQKSLNMSPKIWNWRINFFLQKIFLDT